MDTIDSLKANLDQLGNDLNHQSGNFKDLQEKVAGLAQPKNEVNKKLFEIKSLKTKCDNFKENYFSLQTFFKPLQTHKIITSSDTNSAQVKKQ